MEYIVAILVVFGVSEAVVQLINRLVFRLLRKLTDIFVYVGIAGVIVLACIFIYSGALSSWAKLLIASVLLGIAGGILCAPVLVFSPLLNELSKRQQIKGETFVEQDMKQIPPVKGELPAAENNEQQRAPEVTEQEQFLLFLRAHDSVLREIIEQYKQRHPHFHSPQPEETPPSEVQSSPQPQQTPPSIERIRVSCPHCGQAYKGIHVKFIGKTISCKKCHKKFTIRQENSHPTRPEQQRASESNQ